MSSKSTLTCRSAEEMPINFFHPVFDECQPQWDGDLGATRPHLVSHDRSLSYRIIQKLAAMGQNRNTSFQL
ncbi:Uncharacterized protein TCM_015408 [Theobroma cacao]|uniref:Uncharacterized protein n=1 Tax=Theobroma cacao TaxID=3641 RepID=A0A061G1T5_THECC|nr:Uncharacterized protein TCM_015408 [Theobroma cacao]